VDHRSRGVGQTSAVVPERSCRLEIRERLLNPMPEARLDACGQEAANSALGDISETAPSLHYHCRVWFADCFSLVHLHHLLPRQRPTRAPAAPAAAHAVADVHDNHPCSDRRRLFPVNIGQADAEYTPTTRHVMHVSEVPTAHRISHCGRLSTVARAAAVVNAAASADAGQAARDGLGRCRRKR
jgi:hypothetical protein